MERPSWAPRDIDLDRPSACRVYDYFLGGAHNFAVDRQLVDALTSMTPAIGDTMRANRAFLRRAVRFLVSQGITQFLDVGSGIHTVGNVHQIAQRADPSARVVYVDIDPIAVSHSRAILADDPQTASIRALLLSSSAGATAYLDADLYDADNILRKAADVLTDYDWLRRDIVQAGAAGGRPSDRYLINPALLKGGAV